MLKEETDINVRLLEEIRDDLDNLPAVRMQAIQTITKMVSVDDPIHKTNIEILKEIRDDDGTSDAVKVQIIQTLQKLIVLVEGEPQKDDSPTEESILKKIRGSKK